MSQVQVGPTILEQDVDDSGVPAPTSDFKWGPLVVKRPQVRISLLLENEIVNNLDISDGASRMDGRKAIRPKHIEVYLYVLGHGKGDLLGTFILLVIGHLVLLFVDSSCLFNLVAFD